MSRPNLWSRLVCGAALLAACGCQTANDRTTVSRGPFRSLWSARTGAAALPKVEPELAPDLRDTTELSLAYARWMEDVGNLMEARRHYSEVADSKPKNIEAALGLARIDQLTGRTHEAEQGFQRALRLAPESPQALHALGQFYASQRRWPEAVEQLNRAMLAAPTERTYRYDLAVAMAHTGDIEGALPHFVRTVGVAEAHYNVGLILKEQGRLAESHEHLLLAVTKKPELHQAQYWLDEVRHDLDAALASQPAASAVQPAAHQRGARYSAPLPAVTGRHSLAPSDGSSRADLTTQQREQQRNQRPAAW